MGRGLLCLRKPGSAGHITPGNQIALPGPKPGERTWWAGRLPQNSPKFAELSPGPASTVVPRPLLKAYRCLLELVLGEGWRVCSPPHPQAALGAGILSSSTISDFHKGRLLNSKAPQWIHSLPLGKPLEKLKSVAGSRARA